MKRIVRLSFVGLTWGCGAGESVTNAAPEDTNATAPAAPAVTAGGDAPMFSCTDGNERVELDNGHRVITIDAACGDAVAPNASMLPGGEDGPWPLQVTACKSAASVLLEAEEYQPVGGVGSFAGTTMKFNDGSGLVLTWGTVNVQKWAPVGELVSGTFTSSSEPLAPKVSGSFCVRRTK